MVFVEEGGKREKERERYYVVNTHIGENLRSRICKRFLKYLGQERLSFLNCVSFSPRLVTAEPVVRGNLLKG